MKIAIIYGSTGGNTESAATKIAEKLAGLGEVLVCDVAKFDMTSLPQYDAVLLGSSTWGCGDLQDDWYGRENLDGANLAGKKAAVFGTGDQTCYGDTFVDALATLADSAQDAGAAMIGSWPTEGYEYSDSRALNGDKFIGLALDDDNQPELTDERIERWAQQLITELA